MCKRLVELIRDLEEVLFPNSRKANAESERIAAWRSIRDTLNREFPEIKCTEKQIQTKWKNLKMGAKEDAQLEKR